MSNVAVFTFIGGGCWRNGCRVSGPVLLAGTWICWAAAAAAANDCGTGGSAWWQSVLWSPLDRSKNLWIKSHSQSHMKRKTKIRIFPVVCAMFPRPLEMSNKTMKPQRYFWNYYAGNHVCNEKVLCFISSLARERSGIFSLLLSFYPIAVFWVNVKGTDVWMVDVCLVICKFCIQIITVSIQNIQLYAFFTSLT